MPVQGGVEVRMPLQVQQRFFIDLVAAEVSTPRSTSLKPIEGSILPRKPRNLQRVLIPSRGEGEG
jgi:hypothetical protein